MIFTYHSDVGYHPYPCVSVGEGEKQSMNALPLIPESGNRSVLIFDSASIDVNFKILESGYTHIRLKEEYSMWEEAYVFPLSEVVHDGIATVEIPTLYRWGGVKMYARLETQDGNDNILYYSEPCELLAHEELEPNVATYTNSGGGTGLCVTVSSRRFKPKALITSDGTIPLTPWDMGWYNGEDVVIALVADATGISGEVTVVCECEEYGMKASSIVTIDDGGIVLLESPNNRR